MKRTVSSIPQCKRVPVPGCIWFRGFRRRDSNHSTNTINTYEQNSRVTTIELIGHRGDRQIATPRKHKTKQLKVKYYSVLLLIYSRCIYYSTAGVNQIFDQSGGIPQISRAAPCVDLSGKHVFCCCGCFCCCISHLEQRTQVGTG